MALKFCFKAATITWLSLNIWQTPAYADELVELGKKLSETHCARCHVVDEKNPFGGISSTPSFRLMVNGLADWQDRFLSFHTRLPHPSIIRFKGEPVDKDNPPPTLPVVLEYTDIDAITAFATTLKKK